MSKFNPIAIFFFMPWSMLTDDSLTRFSHMLTGDLAVTIVFL